VAAPLDPANPGGGTIEGVIDLIFENPSGDLVIVDYKTDRVAGTGLEEAAAPYVSQLGAYVYAVERSTGCRVAEAIILFARRADVGEPAEYVLADIPGAVESSLRLARAQVGG
jgi:ATP-dependent exoDNAse (exonuclease V) beta subunit